MAPYSSNLRLGYGAGRTGEQISVFTGGPTAGTVPVIFCHGFLGDATQAYGISSNAHHVAATIARTGLVVAGPDLGLGDAGLNNWGHNDTVDPGGAIDDAIDFLAAEHGTRTDKVGIYGTSMGGTAAAWIWRNLDRLAAAAFTIPCLALEALHEQNPVGLATFIDLAYAGEGGLTASLPTHDPSHPDNLAALATVADRIRVWYSADDNVISAADVEAFAEATGVVAVNMGNVGHNEATSRQQVADFIVPRLWWA